MKDRGEELVDDRLNFPELFELEKEVGEAGEGVANDARRVVVEHFE